VESRVVLTVGEHPLPLWLLSSREVYAQLQQWVRDVVERH
jgi:hypothetical protein